ncbi:MAG: DUF58 domain-containing protein [Elusimicrobia bacterium]|nr:DUF58 domain-containing protein [Elusimicrobiota bacterium]
MTFIPPHRGRVRFDQVRLTTTFPFGLFAKTATLPFGKELIIYPAIDHQVKLPEWPQGIAAVESRPERGFGPTFWGLRAFVPGDYPRLIHWRASARQGTLMVREMEREVDHQILLSLAPWEKFLALPDSQQETVIALAASLAWRMSERGDAVGLQLPGTFLSPEPGREALHRLVRTLALLDPHTVSNVVGREATTPIAGSSFSVLQW